MTKNRLFLAAPISEQVRQGLATFLKTLSEKHPLPGRLPPPENWHFTLKFLGNVDESDFRALLNAMESSDLGHTFRIGLKGLGVFPRPAKASVFWVGVEQGRDALCELAENVEETAHSIGFPKEARPFHPHLTISRIRPPQNLKKLLDNANPFGMVMPVEEVLLYKSHLSSKGARYEALQSFPLKKSLQVVN